jgi:hypothetical protein
VQKQQHGIAAVLPASRDPLFDSADCDVAALVKIGNPEPESEFRTESGRTMSDVPSGYARLEKSERDLVPNSQLIGPADTNEVISVSVRVRRGSDAPALPDMSDLASTPGSSRQYMSREEFANLYGAAPDDLKAWSAQPPQIR